MLKALYEKFCASSLSVGIVEAGERHGLLLTPDFAEDGRLARLDISILPSEQLPVADATPAFKPLPQEEVGQVDRGGAEMRDPGFVENQRSQPQGTGATELDPVTGKEVLKAAEHG